MHNPVVKMVPGLVYWRQHEDQEITKGRDSYFYLENTYKHQLKVLNDKDVPLTRTEVQAALKKINKRFSRDLLLLLKHGHFNTANQIRKTTKVSWLKILKSAL